MDRSAIAQSPALNLVPINEVTNTVNESGNWTNPEIWSGGNLPEPGARIHVPQGVVLTVDAVVVEEFKTIRVDGKLAFATDRDTELRVDAMVSTMMAELEIGTAISPVQSGATAKVIFSDDGPIDIENWDPAIISRGALLMGQTTMHGQMKTAFVSMQDSQQAQQGSNQITLANEPLGWQVDDQIVIAGVDANDPQSDEVVSITEINGVDVTFSPSLVRDHVAPRPEFEVHVANLTRNIQFSSANTSHRRRGHIMFMHTNNVDVRYANFTAMGRTDKSIDLEDWQLVSGSEESICPDDTIVELLGGFNVRGRYSIHFHRGGPSGTPATIQGNVVRDDIGWAYVNHSANVDFLDNISHNCTGAAFNTEAGDEIGSFISNMAIRTFNPNGNPNPPDNEAVFEQSPDIRVLTQDFGWQGDGFWFHGAGVTVDNNVVCGASGHAYIYWTLGLVERGLGENRALVDNLPNGSMIGPPGTKVRTKHVPVPSFDGNIAYAVPKGLVVAYLHTDNRDDGEEFFTSIGKLHPVPQTYEETLHSTFSNFLAWNISLGGVAAPYSGRITFDNVEVFGTGEFGSVGIKLDQFSNQNDISVRDIHVEDFVVGVAAQRQGDAVIENAQISCITDIRISLPDRDGRNLEISNIEFLPLNDVFSGEERIKLDLNPAFDLGIAGGLFGIEDEFFDEEMLLDVPPIFQRDRIVFNNPGFSNVGLYFFAQAETFIPVPVDSELSDFVDTNLIGLTNGEMQQQFGISLADALLPADNFEDPIAPNAYFGSALPPYCSLPPNDDTYWQNFFGLELKGDVNGDGSVNLLDVAPFIQVISNGEYSEAADVNSDGTVNLLDVGPFVCQLSSD